MNSANGCNSDCASQVIQVAQESSQSGTRNNSQIDLAAGGQL